MVHRLTSLPCAHAWYVEQCASALRYVSIAVPVHDWRFAQPSNVSGTDGKPSAALPPYGTSGSSVPWKWRMGTGRAGVQVLMPRTPATGATAAMRVDISHARRCD